MLNAPSPPGSNPEFDYQKAVGGKTDDRYILKGLALNRWINRPLAGLIVRALFRTRVSPNQVTLAAFALGMAGAFFFYRGSAWSSALGGVLAQLSSIVDCADGMLARARGRSSEYGASLDLLLDRVNEFFLLVGAVLGYYAASGRTGLLILGLLGTALFFLLTTLFYLIKNYRHDAAKGEAAENRAWLMALLCVFGALNRIDLGIYVLAIGMAGSILVVIVIFFRLRPRRSRPEPAGGG
jgi:phosphatidylglycerophosphate synthase